MGYIVSLWCHLCAMSIFLLRDEQLLCPVTISNLLVLAGSLVEFCPITAMPADTKAVLTVLGKLKFLWLGPDISS